MRRGVAFAARSTWVLFCALALCCSGCFHRRILVEHGYRLGENSGAPMLVPADNQRSDAGDFQTTRLVLSGGTAGARDGVKDQCVIEGEVFSVRAASREDPRNWIVRSPSVAGWSGVAGKVNIGSQWKSFTHDLERMDDDGCFPSGMTALEIRGAIARRIPLPADELRLFFYSDRQIGFTDLTPGMEVRLQRFVPTAKSIKGQGPPRWWVADYEVVPRDGRGVALKLARKVKGSDRTTNAEEKELLSLPDRFAQTPVLRLFLEGVYGKGQVSHGILVGAVKLGQLDAVTDRIRQGDPAKCAIYEETVCTEFPLGAVSLFSTVRVNGRRAQCLFGESLAGFWGSLYGPGQAVGLEKVHVFRRMDRDRYGEIDFPRTEDGARLLLLLPGDRIEWRR